MGEGGRTLLSSILYVTLYILTTAGSFILIRWVGLALPDMLMVFLTTSYAVVAFHLVNLGQITGMYRTLFATMKLRYLQLNIALLVAWIGSFLIPIYFSPSPLLVAGMSITSFCGFLAMSMSTRSRVALINCILLGANLLVFYLLYHDVYRGWTYVVFCTSTAAVGVAMFAILRVSGAIQQGGMTASQILAARAWLLWLIPLVYVIVDHQYRAITLAVLGQTAVLSLVSLILPLYFLQRSIAVLGADMTGIFAGLTPVVIVGLELAFLGRVHLADAVAAIILSVITVVFGVYRMRRGADARGAAS